MRPRAPPPTPPGAASTPSAPTGTTCARTRVPFASRIVLEYFNLSNVTTRLSCSSSELRYSDRALEHLAVSVAPSPNVVVVSITPRVPLVRASEVNASRFALSSPLATPHVTSNVVVVVAPRPSPPVVSGMLRLDARESFRELVRALGVLARESTKTPHVLGDAVDVHRVRARHGWLEWTFARE